jgi:hypothetical protein
MLAEYDAPSSLIYMPCGSRVAKARVTVAELVYERVRVILSVF